MTHSFSGSSQVSDIKKNKVQNLLNCSAVKNERWLSSLLANIHLFKVSNWNRKRCEIYLKLTIDTRTMSYTEPCEASKMEHFRGVLRAFLSLVFDRVLDMMSFCCLYSLTFSSVPINDFEHVNVWRPVRVLNSIFWSPPNYLKNVT